MAKRKDVLKGRYLIKLAKQRKFNDLADRINKDKALCMKRDGQWFVMMADYYGANFEPTWLMMETLHKKPIYRLELSENCLITVECYDLIPNFDPELKGCYDAAADMPKWAQEKLAVLMVLDPDEPTGEIEGVGRRINRRVFWIYPNGNDAGSESKSRH